MSAAATRSAADAKDPLLSLAEHLPDPSDRAWYGALVSYVHSLPPEDELVRVAQLFGFLTLIGRQLPESLAAEQAKWREFWGEAYPAVQEERRLTEHYHQELQERLNQLPREIAAGVQPAAIAKAMGESFRQQLVATGIEESKTFLTDATRDLKKVAGDVAVAVKPIAGQYADIATTINANITALKTAATTLDTSAIRLTNTAGAVDLKNTALAKELREWEWWMLPTIAFIIFLLGAGVGVYWQQGRTDVLVRQLQGQTQQLQNAVQALPAALAPLPPVPTPKRLKKNP